MSYYYIGVDIGGTFTDCAVVDEGGRITAGKALSTPDDFSRGFFQSIEDAAGSLGVTVPELLSRTKRLAHGTTVGINALVTRQGARVGLLTTKGHPDALKIMDNTGRVTGASIEEVLNYASSTLPEQIVPPECVREITERIDFEGDVVVSLDRDQAGKAIRELIDTGVESLAIALLWSFANPAHEQELAALVREIAPNTFLSISHEVAPKIAEYPRTATTVFNSYIGPVMQDYISHIMERASQEGYRYPVMFATSSGGLVNAETARRTPVLTLQSGPVAGVVATGLMGSEAGFPNAIATDMGGTTLDVSVVTGGRPVVRDVAVVERHQLHLRMVDVESIGAGGGSIAWFDPETNTVRVGPQSAGSDPGPACYGRGGTQPTVTDADLLLGVLNPDGILGGRLKLDKVAAERAIGEIAERMNMDPVACAAGIVEIVDARMEDLVRRMTIQRGLDPRDMALLGYGGGAAAHAGLYGRGLGVSRLIIPLANIASVWSALGIAVSDIVRTYERPTYMHAPFDPEQVSAIFGEMEEAATRELQAEGADVSDIVLDRLADMKYGLQVFEVEAPVPSGELHSDKAMDRMVENFEEAYAIRFGKGSGYREAGVILTALRVEARGLVHRPPLERKQRAPAAVSPEAAKGTRDVYWYELRRRVETAILDGQMLLPGNQLTGPAIVEYPFTTAVVRPSQSAEVDEWGNLVIYLYGMAETSSVGAVGEESA